MIKITEEIALETTKVADKFFPNIKQSMRNLLKI